MAERLSEYLTRLGLPTVDRKLDKITHSQKNRQEKKEDRKKKSNHRSSKKSDAL